MTEAQRPDPVSARLRAIMLINDRIFDNEFRGKMTYLGTEGGDHIVEIEDLDHGTRTFEVDLVTQRVSERHP